MESKKGNYYGRILQLYKWECTCGQIKWLPNSELKRIKFCSRNCYSNSKIKEKIELTCASCKTNFYKLKTKLNSNSGLYFCTRKCLDNSRKINGIIIPIHYGTSKNKKINIICINCNKEAIISVNSKGKYCNFKCQNDFQHKQYIERWLQGLETGYTHGGLRYNISQSVRRYMFEINNNKCEQCGWSKRSEYTGKIPLQVDHIDGDHKNNKPENLRLLCPNCHTLTANYGSLNKGKGRKDKIEYYHKNKHKPLT